MTPFIARDTAAFLVDNAPVVAVRLDAVPFDGRTMEALFHEANGLNQHCEVCQRKIAFRRLYVTDGDPTPFRVKPICTDCADEAEAFAAWEDDMRKRGYLNTARGIRR